jgi:hypothetical protein
MVIGAAGLIALSGVARAQLATDVPTRTEVLELSADRQTPLSPPPTAAQGAAGLSDADRQAAYCMEVSFGYTWQYKRLVAVLRENLERVEALRDRPDLPQAGRDQFSAAARLIAGRIAAEEAAGKRWDDRTKLFIGYLHKRGLLGGATFAAISQDVTRDQQAVSDIYSACLRLCDADDQACRNACNGKAKASEPGQRGQRCEQVAASLE